MTLCKCCGIERRDYELDKENCFDCERKLSYLPPFFRHKDFTNYEGNKQIIDKCKEFGKTNKGLFLTGDVGTGKTHLAIATIKGQIKLGEEIKVIIMPSLFLQLRQSFNGHRDGITELDIIEVYQTGVVLFDDFGCEKQTEYTIQTIYTLINNRYNNNNHKIIITSNLNLQMIASVMSDRIASRLAEMCDVVKIEGKDYRVKRGIK